MKRIITNKNLCYLLTFLIYITFFLGFFFKENSIGSGGYDGDLEWIWKNFEIFKNNTLIDSINSEDFFGNRTPLLYIINILFNPFINNIDNYRISIFLLSFLGPILFYACLRKNYPSIDKEIIILLSSIILLSPYYRASAYWGMEINYGIITSLLSILLLKKIENNNSKLNTFFLILFSSITVYFDHKLLIIPLISFFKILIIKNKNIIIYTTFLYFLFALPFLYLIFLWGGLVPYETQIANQLTVTSLSRLNSLNYYNIGYAITICAFYLFPFVFMKNNNLITNIKSFSKIKINFFYVSIIITYLIFLEVNYSYEYYTIETYQFGLGIIHKLSLLLFENLFLQKIFTYFSIMLSWILILLVLEKNKNDFLILGYFIFLSIILWPMTQEYFDPILIICFLLLFQTKIDINLKNTLILNFYLFIFLFVAIFYYY